MKLACLCPTYGRPRLLEHAIQCFLDQDYPADQCELVILDDAGQYECQEHSGPKPWRVISVPQRFWTLGEKRNAVAALASPDVEGYVCWDDDDIYLPWTLKAHAAALKRASWARPSAIIRERKTGTFELRPSKGIYHGSWSWTRELFQKVRGYPFMQSGQDQAIGAIFRKLRIPEANPLALGFKPYYIYRWETAKTWHLSVKRGDEGYRMFAQKAGPISPETLRPNLPERYTHVEVSR